MKEDSSGHVLLYSPSSLARRKLKRLQSASLDHGGWLCKHCGYPYPMPHPNHYMRREHKKICPNRSQAKDTGERRGRLLPSISNESVGSVVYEFTDSDTVESKTLPDVDKSESVESKTFPDADKSDTVESKNFPDVEKSGPSEEPRESTHHGSEAEYEKVKGLDGKEPHSVHVAEKDPHGGSSLTRESFEEGEPGNEGRGLSAAGEHVDDLVHSSDAGGFGSEIEELAQDVDGKDDGLTQGPSGGPAEAAPHAREADDEKMEVLGGKEPFSVHVPEDDSHDGSSLRRESLKEGETGNKTGGLSAAGEHEPDNFHVSDAGGFGSEIEESAQEEASEDDGLKQGSDGGPTDAAVHDSEAEDEKMEVLKGKKPHSEHIPEEGPHDGGSSKRESLEEGEPGISTRGLSAAGEHEPDVFHTSNAGEFRSEIEESAPGEAGRDDGLKQDPSGEPTEGAHHGREAEDEKGEGLERKGPVSVHVPEEDPQHGGSPRSKSLEGGEQGKGSGGSSVGGHDTDFFDPSDGGGFESSEVDEDDKQEDSKMYGLEPGPSGELTEAEYHANKAEDEKVKVLEEHDLHQEHAPGEDSQDGGYPRIESFEEGESENESRGSSAAAGHETDFFDPSDDTGFESSDMGGKEEDSLQSEYDMLEEETQAEKVEHTGIGTENEPSQEVDSYGESKSSTETGYASQIRERSVEGWRLINVANLISHYESRRQSSSNLPSDVTQDDYKTLEGRSLPTLSTEVGEITLEADELDEASMSTAYVVEFDVVRMLREQKTHDLICPVCGSQITNRIIIRKKKRTFVSKEDVPQREITQEMQEENREVHKTSTGNTDGTWVERCVRYFTRRDTH